MAKKYVEDSMPRELVFSVKPKNRKSWEDILKLDKKIEKYIRGRGYSGPYCFDLCRGGREGNIYLYSNLSGMKDINRNNYESSYNDLADELSEIFNDYDISFVTIYP